MSNRYLSAEVRFWMKVEKTEGCWHWRGAFRRGKYGMFCNQARLLLPHRFAYELCVGPIPDGLTIDHLCGNKLCVNPAHLEPVTRGENARRYGLGLTACAQGHTYDEANTYRDRYGYRSCRTCARNRWRMLHWGTTALPEE